MEQVFGSDPIPSSGSFDKNKVMDVKPLRCLVPIFPSPPGASSSSSPQTSPFVCAPPTGPYPSGYNSFYPFNFPQNPENLPGDTSFGFNNTIPAPTPISSFQIPPGDPTNGGMKVSGKKEKKRGKKNSDSALDALAKDFLSLFDLTVFDSSKKSDGDKEIVRYVLMIMNFLRRRLTCVEDSNEATPGVARRPDLKAGAILMSRGVRTNMTKRVGAVPGVEIGDIFYFRMELCLVGTHAPSMAGIDYMSINDEPIAVSIVSSGGYEDNNEDTDILIYSGQGGNMNKKDKFIDLSDQKLERGNLALEKSLHRGNEVRVIRGLRDMTTVGGKIYLYDGLYKIQESWMEKGKSNFNIFKYKLVRIPGQPQGFAIWKAIQQWKDGGGPRPGVILPDITYNGEILPVSLVNNVDEEKGPTYFTYISTLKYNSPVNLPCLSRCSCKTACDASCSCVEKNGGSYPYNTLGVLMNCKSIIYECGSSCSCPATCRNRVTQAGLKTRLEVFKTNDRGWGLRSLDPIRSGAFICEYAGEVIDGNIDNDDDYIFDATRIYQPHEIMIDSFDEATKLPYNLVISAKNMGNVSRFMNHSCTPNVYWQPVMRERDDQNYMHIVFFAINNIPPMRELTFDYGIIRSGNVEHRREKCLCGSIKCRDYFY